MATERSIRRRERYNSDPAFRANLQRISKLWKTRNPERQARADRTSRLRSRYGIEPSTYERMLEEQGGLCAICRRPCSTGRRLSVDHDRRTKRVRGLLCNRCNRGIGYLGDDAERLEEAVAYLRRS